MEVAMKLKRPLVLLFTCLIASIVFLQCNQCSPLANTQFKDTVTLVTYNTQTFFDAVEGGHEFKAFKGSTSRWSTEKYSTRLERLKETLLTVGERLTGEKNIMPDIAVLQEIEDDSVVRDFCKRLPSNEYYPYAVCPSREDGAFTTVILSKYPIEDFVVHRLHLEQKVPLRPLTEVVLNIGDEKHPQLLTIFAVHWKSKSRGAFTTKIRAMQELQLMQKIQAHRAEKPHIPFIVCGDFNQTFEEFNESGDLSVCWNSKAYEQKVEEGVQPAGSYYFRGIWEKIDHIFYDSPDNSSHSHAYVEPIVFFVLYEPPLIKDGVPFRYDILTGKGYSDHLPLGFRFKIGTGAHD